MTLVQTFFSADFVIQVSDRRLTKADGSVFDDDYTKLVYWNHAFTAGFSGLARIDRSQRKSTSEWIAEVLTEHLDFGCGVSALQRKSEAAIGRLPSTWDRRLAIVVAGFDATGLRCAQVSNFNVSTGAAGDQNVFELFAFEPVTGHHTGSHTAGAPLDETQTKVLRRYLPRIVSQPNGINRAIRVLVENQRRVAAANDTVGLHAQCVFIPKQQRNPGTLVSNLDGTEISTEGSNFGYFDADGFQYKQLGPLMAHGGFVQDQLIGTADPLNPDNQRVGFRLVKVPWE